MKKLMTLMGLAALSFSAFALTTNKVGFETGESYAADDTVATKTEPFENAQGELVPAAHVWYGADDDASVVKTYTDAGVTPYTYTTTSLVDDGPGSQFLSVEASSAPLVRSLANYQSGDEPSAQDLDGDVVADTLVQFTASEEMQTVDPADGTKFALWLYADPEGATNLYVTAGSYAQKGSGAGYDVTATNFTLATTQNVLPNTWHRVTIRAINGIIKGNDDNLKGIGFVVYVDGVVATCSDNDYAAKVGSVKNAYNTPTLEAEVLIARKQLFLSMVAGENQLTGIGFKGTGLIDDLSIVSKSDAPTFVNEKMFVITWDANVVSFTVGGTTYPTADEEYVVVTPDSNGLVTLTDVVYAEGYVAGEWTANGATANATACTFTLGQGVDFADGMIVSAAETVTSPFIINGQPASGTIATLADAIDALGNEGGTIALAEDYVMSAGLHLNPDSPVAVVLDLQGHEISCEDEYQFWVSNGSLNIIDTVGGGSVVASGTAFYLDEHGEVIIGNNTTDQGVIIDGAICESETEGLSIVLGKFTSEDAPAEAYIAEGSICSETKVDGYWVVAPGEAPEPTFDFTINPIEHTTYTYTVDGVASAELTDLTNGTKVVVTYAAAPGYKFTEATAANAVKEYTISGQNGQTDQTVAVALDCTPWAYSSQIVVWRATLGQLFHASTVAEVDEYGQIGESYTLTNGGAHPWQIFASNQSAYSAPGATLVFDEAGYNNNSDAQFAPMSFGGMWVMALQADNTPYCIANGNTTSDRTVELGATNAPCYFKFDESFTFDRSSATKVLGTATVEIASGKTFTINARANTGAVVDADSTLILKGAGTLAVNGGLAVNGTLDLSEATRPVIDGDVGLYGTIVLPAGTEVSPESPFTVCSGTLSGLNVFVKIGDAEAVEKSFTAANGAITSFGDPVYEFSENYPTVVPAGKTYTFVGGETPETATTVDTVAVYGTLETSGYITLNGLSILTGGTLDVLDSTATATATTYGSWGDKQILGNIIVRAGATFKPTQNDFLDWSGATDQTIDIYGTLAMGTTRWSIKSNANCKINLYPGAHVTGTGDGNGVFDLINSASKLNVYSGENGGEVVIDGVVKTRNANTPIWVAANTTLKIGGLRAGGVNKSGNGTLEISGTVDSPAASTVSEGTVAFVDTTVAVPITVNAGKTVTASASESVTVPLNVTMNASANITVSGAGTVNGTVAFGGKPTGTLTGLTTSTWQGTVSIPALSAPGNLSVLTNCGNADSVISLAGTSGNSFIMASGSTTYSVGTVNIAGNVEFNDGSSASIVNFAKVTGEDGVTLVLGGWAGCSSARYNLNEIDYAGTLVVSNGITRGQGGTFTIGLGNIVSATATPGSRVIKLTQKAIDGATGTVVFNTDSARLNGNAAKFAITANGVYVAAASSSIGGVVAYYNMVMEAYNAVSANGVAGDSFTVLDGNEYGDIEGFEYNSETKTYTKVVTVAQFTYGVTTYSFTTLAAACAAAEEYDPVPAVVLLVALGEQDVPTGWEYNTPEASSTTYGTLTKSAAPSDTYEVSSDTVIGEGGSFTVPEGTTKVKVGGYTLEDGDGISIDGTTVTVLAPAVVEEAEKEAIVIDDDKGEVTLNVNLVEGLYYGVGRTTSLEGGINRPNTLQQYNGSNGASILTVDKPEGDKCFFKVFVDIKQ